MQTSEKNCDCGIAEFWLLSYIPLKSCRVVIAAALPSSCRNATAGYKKNARAHLRWCQRLCCLQCWIYEISLAHQKSLN
jgi:hypothetical protein